MTLRMYEFRAKLLSLSSGCWIAVSHFSGSKSTHNLKKIYICLLAYGDKKRNIGSVINVGNTTYLVYADSVWLIVIDSKSRIRLHWNLEISSNKFNIIICNVVEWNYAWKLLIHFIVPAILQTEALEERWLYKLSPNLLHQCWVHEWHMIHIWGTVFISDEYRQMLFKTQVA
jgi:hypothetical protein